MSDESQATTTRSKPTASVWPMLIAVGLALSEVGVLFAVLPVSVFGLLLFAGGLAGIVSESGYVEEPWTTLAGLALLLVIVGGGLFVAYEGSLLTGGELISVPNGIAYRGISIAVAGVIGVAIAIYGRFYVELWQEPGA